VRGNHIKRHRLAGAKIELGWIVGAVRDGRNDARENEEVRKGIDPGMGEEEGDKVWTTPRPEDWRGNGNNKTGRSLGNKEQTAGLNL